MARVIIIIIIYFNGKHKVNYFAGYLYRLKKFINVFHELAWSEQSKKGGCSIVSQAVIKDFSTNYMTALGPNQAYTSLKLRN